MDFQTMGLRPKLIARLAEQGITEPTPIQAQAIPHAMDGRDVMGLAQTGTGKTAAFGLPLVHMLTGDGSDRQTKRPSALILAPTRELANQIAESLRSFARASHLKVAVVVGGASLNRQAETLRRGTDILVATPGRLIDLLERKAVYLDHARFLVLDEADQMLDMGFIHALRKIAPLLPSERQTMLFSATMPKQMAELAERYLTDPIRVEVARPGMTADKVAQSVHFIPQPEKVSLLTRLLGEHRDERAIVFARTKHGAERLMKQLDRAGFAAGSIHGNKSQGQRDRAIAAFKSSKIKVLVATDVAARGIDIPGVAFVYNFDLPNVPENYVHRIGRTARAGAAGQAVAFCSPDEAGLLADIQKVIKTPIAVASGAPWEVAKPKPKPGRQRNRRRRPRQGARKAA